MSRRGIGALSIKEYKKNVAILQSTENEPNALRCWGAYTVRRMQQILGGGRSLGGKADGSLSIGGASYQNFAVLFFLAFDSGNWGSSHSIRRGGMTNVVGWNFLSTQKGDGGACSQSNCPLILELLIRQVDPLSTCRYVPLQLMCLR